jgi:hypothetical protein
MSAGRVRDRAADATPKPHRSRAGDRGTDEDVSSDARRAGDLDRRGTRDRA